MKKKLKNPITTIRKPEEINKEYSEVIIKLGQFEIEFEALDRAEVRQNERRNELREQKSSLLERVQELSEEMTSAQKRLQEQQVTT